jgi:hypothetical protein
MADERYNGWVNRETWSLALWIDNDQGLYNEKEEKIDSLIDRTIDIDEDTKLAITAEFGEWLKEWIEELKEMRDQSNHSECKGSCLHSMFDDIGSDWRIDYFEIAENWISDKWDEMVKEVKKEEQKLKSI